ncbi:MAG: CocE/NonD family hydrolase [Candidatus Hydrogenedentes bacterium]|nr:CocE/NonD family hydrolase [Candidatus Hydrogenedentota bacterium]
MFRIVYFLVFAAVFITWAEPPAAVVIDVPMRDGVLLKTDVYTPSSGGPAFPVMFIRSPYPRTAMKTEAISFAENGVAAVVQDVRGTGASGGTFTGFLDDGWAGNTDGADTVTWIAEQPWCNGKIGSSGASAGANTQALMAPATDKLSCQYLEVGAHNFYLDVAFPGGVWRPEQTDKWFAMFGEKGESARQTLRSHPTYDAFWANLNADAQASKITAPGMHVGGWFDIFKEGTIRAFTARQYNGGAGAKGNQRMIIKPGGHGEYKSDLPFKFPENIFDVKISRERARFLAHWLTGEENGIDNEPPITYYVIGDDQDSGAPGMEWRTANRWPPFPPREKALYLYGEELTEVLPETVVGREFVFDPASRMPTVGGTNLTIPFGPYDQRELLTRKDLLLFTGPVLAEPVETTGRVRVVLHVSSDAPDTDFTAKLMDVYPNGDERHILVLESIQRVKLREGFDKVAPPLTRDAVVPIEIDLGHISWVFNRGHRMALLISSSNYPHFEVNPNTGEDFPHTELRTAVNAVHTSAQRPSALYIPIRMPELDSDKDGLTDEAEWDKFTDSNDPKSK